MLVAIDASRAAREEKTGVEWYAFHLIQTMKKTTPEGVRVILYSDVPLAGPLAELPPGWSAKVLRWPPQRLWTQVRLAAEVWRDRPKVLFIPAHVAPRCLPRHTRLVTTIHDIAAARFPGAYHWFETWYSLATARAAVRRRATMIVPSEFTKREIISVIAESRPQTRAPHIVVIPHGLDPAYEVRPSAEAIAAAKNTYGIHAPYFIIIGRVEEKKQTARAIEAFAMLKKVGGGAESHQLLIVGKPGFGYETVTAALAHNPFREDILIPGWVKANDLPALLAGAEALLFPSLYEGFGLPALEASALGIPVITLQGHSVEEIGGATFWYAKNQTASALADTIRAVLNDQTERERRCTAAADRSTVYRWATSAALTWKVLLS